MSESTTTSEAAPSDARHLRWAQEEAEAYFALENEDYGTAIATWSAILLNDEKKDFFRSLAEDGENDNGPLREIACCLANAYKAASQDAADEAEAEFCRSSAERLAQEYQLSGAQQS